MGTTLTANDGHSAMLGVFGMLALARLGHLPSGHCTGATSKGMERFVRVRLVGKRGSRANDMTARDLFPEESTRPAIPFPTGIGRHAG